MRDHVQSTWNVYDAYRPIRKTDLDLAGECAAPATASPPTPSALVPPSAKAETQGGTTPVDAQWIARATDTELAALFGVSEMDVRESRRWAREQTERTAGATVTEADPTTKH